MHTKANEWKRPETKSVTLSSGNEVLIRRVRPLDFISTGILPVGLMNIKTDEDRINAFKNHVKDSFEKNPQEIVNTLVMAYVVAPKITIDDDVQEDELHISYISEQEKTEIIHAGNEMSGFTTEALAEADWFRGEELEVH
jgi:hypothetical protein